MEAGYCAPVKDAGDCQAHSSGHWGAREHRIANVSACARRCLGCARCAAVSFSSKLDVCAWHARCDLHDLRRPIGEYDDYVTVRVRSAPAPEWRGDDAAARLRLGVLTLAVGKSMRCTPASNGSI